MDELTFIEQQGQRNAAFSLENWELMNKRTHALLTLLLGGAAGTGAYALGQLGKPGGQWVLWALGTVALWWFVLAAWVAVRALRTQEVRAPAGDGQRLLEHLRGPLAAYIKQAHLDGEDPADGLTLLREGELWVLQKTTAGYRASSTRIAKTLDYAYVGAAVTPVWALLGLALAKFLA